MRELPTTSEMLTRGFTQDEMARVYVCARVQEEVVSGDAAAERARLEKKYGRVWSAPELTADFEVHGFRAPFVIVTRRADGQRGSLCFQHDPRFYFDWREG